jgi:ribosome biogenesis GTPase
MDNLEMICRIIKGVGGLYEVDSDSGGRILCSARGIFRKDNKKPLAGDFAVVSVNSSGEGSIDELLPRKNELLRPPVANIDILFIVTAAVSPMPSLINIDKLTAIAYHNDIEPVIVVNKNDLKDGSELCAVYEKSGIKTVKTAAEGGNSGMGMDEIEDLIRGKVSAFCGASGVGKTSIINLLLPELKADTNTLSGKIERGRHTTR